MIIIGEKINGAIPSVRTAIAERDDSVIRERVRSQVAAGADFLDCAASTDPSLEYDAMCWLIDIIQEETDTPICIDSPNVRILARLIEDGRIKQPGMVNSVNEESDKCEIIFPMIAGTEWNVLGLTCDEKGIPAQPELKLEIAKRIIDKADRYGVARSNLHIDPCVMALATMPSSLKDFITCIHSIHEYAPDIKVGGAISNISYDMPSRKYVNMACLAYAVQAGLDSAIIDPTSENMQGILYAAAALSGQDKGGRKYNRAFRKGLFGSKKV